MIKNFSLLIFLLLSAVTFGQQGSASPYSIFGLGEERYKGTSEIRSMGGVSVFADSIHINLQNPASYANLIYTTFTIGGSFTGTKFKTENTTEKAQRSTMDYLAVGIPISKKSGFGFGVIPMSSVGYKIQNVDDVNLTLKKFIGEGGMNRAFLGFGYKINSKLNLGIDGNYNFGQITTNNISYQTGIEYGTGEYNISSISGFTLNLGAMYRNKIMKKYDFYSGLTYTPQSNLKASNVKDIYTLLYSEGFSPPRIDFADQQNYTTTIKSSSKLAFGAGMGIAKKWVIGGEVTFKGSSTFSNRFNDILNVSYEDAVKYSIGGYYIPKYNSFNNYFKKITYRGGFRYENTGLVINNESIKDYSFTGGLGLPLGGTNSNLNVGFEFGRRGTTAAGLIEENYGSLILSLSFNDRWFIKRKYD
jgi:hypothetical protein